MGIEEGKDEFNSNSANSVPPSGGEGQSGGEGGKGEPSEGKPKSEVTPFTDKFLPLYGFELPFGKAGYFPKDKRELLFALEKFYKADFLNAFLIGEDREFYAPVAFAEKVKKDLEKALDGDIRFGEESLKGYLVLLNAYKETLNEIERFHNRFREQLGVALPKALRELLLLNEHSTLRVELLSVDSLKPAVDDAFRKSALEIRKLEADKERYAEELKKLWEDPYLKKWLGDNLITPGGAKLLLFLKIFKKHLKENIDRAKILELLEKDRAYVETIGDPAKREELEKWLFRVEEILKEAEGPFRVYAKPRDISYAGDIVNLIGDNEKKRYVFLLTKLHNLNLLVDKVLKGELTDRDIDLLFEEKSLGFTGAGNIFKTPQEVSQIKAFFKDYLKSLSSGEIEKPLTRDEYEKLVNHIKTVTLTKEFGELIKNFDRRDRRSNLTKVWNSLATSIGLAKLTFTFRNGSSREFEKCLMKQTNPRECIDMVIRSYLVSATRYREAIEMVRDNSFFTSLFSQYAMLMELYSLIRVFDATVLDKKAEEIEEKLDHLATEVLQKPPKETDNEVRKLLFSETGIYTRLVNPATVNEEIDQFLAYATSENLKKILGDKFIPLAREREFAKTFIELARKYGKEEALRRAVRLSVDPKQIPEEFKERLRNEKLKEFTSKADKVLEGYLALVFYKTFEKNAEKGYREAFKIAVDTLKREAQTVGVNPVKVLNEIAGRVEKQANTLKRAVWVVPKGDKAFLFAVNPYRYDKWLDAFERIRTEKELEEFLRYNFGLSREYIETTNFRNALEVVRNSLVAKGTTIPVSEEVLAKLRAGFTPPKGVDFKAVDRFFEKMSKRFSRSNSSKEPIR